MIPLDRRHPQPERRECQRIRPNPASQIDNVASTRPTQPIRVVPGNLKPRGLLQPGGGEHHAVREISELFVSLLPQPRLGECRRNQLGGITLIAKLCGKREDLLLIVWRKRGEKGFEFHG